MTEIFAKPYDADLKALAQQSAEPAWLTQQRQDSWQTFQAMADPDRVSHLWRYTDPKAYQLTPKVLKAGLQTAIESGSDRDWPTALGTPFKKGHLAAAAYRKAGVLERLQVSEAAAAQGVELIDLRTAASQHPEWIKDKLGCLIGAQHGKFEALHEALWQSGLVLKVPANVELAEPIHIYSEPGRGESFLAPRILVLAGKHSKFTLIDELGEGPKTAKAQVHAQVELFLEDGSHVRQVTVQRLNGQSRHFLTQRGQVGRDARLGSLIIAFGAKSAKVDMGTILQGKGAHADTVGLVLGSARQQFDHHTEHLHRADHTTSDLDFRVVLDGRAHSAYTGLIRIDEGSRFCDAHQTNHNLLLSEKAKAESIPELEILNEEVACSHGATVGPVDPDQLFYLQSRGLQKELAKNIIVRGFVEPTLARLPDDLRKRVTKLVEQRLTPVKKES